MKIKIRDMKDKIEMNGLIYCIGENGGFSGIFIEKEANTGSQIIESYSNGKITKKLEYKKISTNNSSYKMFLVKSMVYRKGELFQTKEYKYDEYEDSKVSISEEKTFQDNNQNKIGIKKIMFENEVLEIGKINEKYNPTAVKKIDGIKPLWTLWLSMMLWFTQNPESFLITFTDGKQLKLINSKNVILEDDFTKEIESMIRNVIFSILILLIIYWIMHAIHRDTYYY
ncbi:hypothetical protein [Fusobacterium massiliense]|uniref:hypothetical protein n=1 Tax=Fusobacterium massiliense TaxID=1852365 RepID=UPI000A4C204F|nr:hypothetical protein [Fusobacterium massiliense]